MATASNRTVVAVSDFSTIVPKVEAFLLVKDSDLAHFLLYGIQGGIICIASLPIFLTVAKYSALNNEKHYIVVAGLALADGLNGFAYFAGGVYRSTMIFLGQQNVLVTARDCIWTLHNILWVWTDTIAPLMLLVASIDRLVSVVAPMQYLKLPRSYALKLVSVAFGYSLLSGGIGVLSSYLKENDRVHPRVCYFSSATGGMWYAYYALANTFFAFSSVGVYALVVLFARIYYRRKFELLMKSNSTQAIKVQAKQQKQMTVSLAISGLFTFILFCVPYGIASVNAVWNTRESVQLTMYAYILSNLNPMFNALIYWTRHREVRIGICALCARREMAPTLHAWLRADPEQIKTQNNRSMALETVT